MTEPEYTTITEDSASLTADERRETETTANQPAASPAPSGAEAADQRSQRQEDKTSAGATAAKAVKLCRHVKEDGVFCGRPALRERLYCYQHLRLRGQQMRMARARAQRLSCPLMLPALDDLEAVKAALTQVRLRHNRGPTGASPRRAAALRLAAGSY
jgi:hypothetical protein